MPGIEREWVALELNELLVVEFYSRKVDSSGLSTQLLCFAFSCTSALWRFFLMGGGCLPTGEMADSCASLWFFPEAAGRAGTLVEQTLIPLVFADGGVSRSNRSKAEMSSIRVIVENINA